MYTETTPKHTLLQCGQPIQLNEARKPLCQRLRNFTLEQARVITPDQERKTHALERTTPPTYTTLSAKLLRYHVQRRLACGGGLSRAVK